MESLPLIHPLQRGGGDTDDPQAEDIHDDNAAYEESLLLGASEEADLNRAILMSLRDDQNILPLPPSEAAISTLVGMGFDRAQAEGALHSTNNDVEAAANFLLSNL